MPFMQTMPFVHVSQCHLCTQCQLCAQCHLCMLHNANYASGAQLALLHIWHCVWHCVMLYYAVYNIQPRIYINLHTTKTDSCTKNLKDRKDRCQYYTQQTLPDGRTQYAKRNGWRHTINTGPYAQALVTVGCNTIMILYPDRVHLKKRR